MAATFEIPNYSSKNIKERTTLGANAAAGATSLTLANNQNITGNDPIVIGQRGSETSEIVNVNSASGATVVIIGTTRLPHSLYDPVIALVGYQIKIYRAANADGTAPADTAFTLLGSPFNIDPDQQMTNYTDTGGSSDYWYKFTYFNPNLNTETAIADAVAVRGGGVGNYCSIDNIRKEAKFEFTPAIGDDDIDTQRRAAQAIVNGRLNGVYVVPFSNPINPLIDKITVMLAAGYLMNDQYGNGQGDSKITWAETQLGLLVDGTLTLAGSDGSVIPTTDSNPNSTLSAGGYPNGQTEFNGGGGFMFEPTDRY